MSERLESFKQLKAWQKSHNLVVDIYRATKQFPKDELFGLVSQMRRSAVSIPANIAEGFKKRGKLDKIRFYNIAQGSLEELKYYLILSNDLGYIKVINDYESISEEISKMLTVMIRVLETGDI